MGGTSVTSVQTTEVGSTGGRQTSGVIFLEECQSSERSLILYVFNVSKGIQGIVLQHEGGVIYVEGYIYGGIART